MLKEPTGDCDFCNLILEEEEGRKVGRLRRKVYVSEKHPSLRNIFLCNNFWLDSGFELKTSRQMGRKGMKFPPI